MSSSALTGRCTLPSIGTRRAIHLSLLVTDHARAHYSSSHVRSWTHVGLSGSHRRIVMDLVIESDVVAMLIQRLFR
jgi:hypothetical protein